MDADEQAFLNAIATAPGDAAPKHVFADWLDERDRPEEATWYRAWTPEAAAQARAWFDEFAAGHYHYTDYGTWSDPDDDTGHEITGAEAIQAGREWLVTLDSEWNQGQWFTQVGSESLRDHMYEKSNRFEFWRNYALATGTYVDVAAVAPQGNVFSCSC